MDPNGSQWYKSDGNCPCFVGNSWIPKRGQGPGGMASGCHGWRGECLGYVPEQTISHVKSSRPSAEAAEKGHLQLIPSGNLT